MQLNHQKRKNTHDSGFNMENIIMNTLQSGTDDLMNLPNKTRYKLSTENLAEIIIQPNFDFNSSKCKKYHGIIIDKLVDMKLKSNSKLTRFSDNRDIK